MRLHYINRKKKVGFTHLEIHEGQTRQIRAQSAAPSDPDTEQKVGTADTTAVGEMFYDTDYDHFCIYSSSTWYKLKCT